MEKYILDMTGWVPIDKSLVRTMSLIDRPFSYVEAMFSHSVNVNCGKKWSIKGYAEAWKWDRKKVKKFIEEIPTDEGYSACKIGMGTGYKIQLIMLDGIGTQSGHNEDTMRTQLGHVHSNDINNLQDNRDTMRTQSGHNEDTMRYPIIKNKNKNKNNKKEKDSRFDARLFLSERNVLTQHISDWLEIRKGKSLKPTITAFKNIETEAEKAKMTLPQAIEKCCIEGWAGFKASWLEKEKNSQPAGIAANSAIEETRRRYL